MPHTGVQEHPSFEMAGHILLPPTLRSNTGEISADALAR
jgi:hypothetical protein